VTILDQALEQTFPSVFNRNGLIPDAVTVIAGTSVYDSWESIRINRTLEALSSDFSISMADKWRDSKSKWPLVPGTPLLVKIGRESVINGYIDTLDVSISNEDRVIQITGRDKTGDLVDSSAYSDPSEFKNIKLEALAKKFATEIFGIKVKTEADTGLPFQKFTIKQGETVFEMLERAAKLRGLLLLSNANGDLVITSRSGGDIGDAPSLGSDAPSISKLTKAFDFPTGGLLKSEVALVQGENILEARAAFDDTERFQTYFVKGQSAGSDIFNGKSVTQVSATARDLAIKRSRTKILIADGSVDKTAAQKRANWEAIVSATRALEVNVKVQGWQKSDGKLWDVNELIRVEAPFIGVDADLLTTNVTLLKSIDSGTITNIRLSRPDSYNASSKELSADSDPANNLGWESQSISAAIDAVRGLV